MDGMTHKDALAIQAIFAVAEERLEALGKRIAEMKIEAKALGDEIVLIYPSDHPPPSP